MKFVKEEADAIFFKDKEIVVIFSSNRFACNCEVLFFFLGLSIFSSSFFLFWIVGNKLMDEIVESCNQRFLIISPHPVPSCCYFRLYQIKVLTIHSTHYT